MVKVEMELKDANEMNGFNNFVQQVEGYRLANSPEGMAKLAAQEHSNRVQAATTAVVTEHGETLQKLADNPVAEAQYEKTPVVAAITPEGVVKPPKESEMIEATQAYMKAHGTEKAFELVRKYGVMKITELKDPVKLAALYAEFKAGVA